MRAPSLLDSLQPEPAPRKRLPVLLPYPFAGPFDYAVPPGMDARPGDLVLVPLNRRAEVGVVWDTPHGDPVPPTKLKPIDAVLDAPPMQPALRRFIDWVAAYTLAPPGDVLAMALRVNALTPPTPQAGWTLGVLPPTMRLTEARRRVAALLADGTPRSGPALARDAGVTAGVVRTMAAAGLLLPTPLPLAAPFAPPDPAHPGPALSPDQAIAGAALRAAVAAQTFGVTLLEGVTGSGKTEVYLEAVAECVAAGRQALVLLPEIALSSQWLERFTVRFGTAPAVWHSDLPSRTRRITWRAVAEGGAAVVVGARSALFLPFPDLGLVVVDEEHETAFKQEDGVTYHARDMAVVRAMLCQAPAVLVSATPSLETLANVEAGRYRRLTLPTRHGGASLPGIAAIDLRDHTPERGHFLSAPLVQAIRTTIGRGEQAMLFLNRRGYAPLTLCRTCGHRMQCPNCTAWLVEHRARRALACHHCGHTEPIPPLCPICAAENSLVPIGPGVERITEEATALFPDARLLVMASDTVPGPAAAAAAAQAITARQIDLIIGTQIVAKGWHFPHLTLVGVVDADLGLAGGDLRAAERTVQLLHQVAGRAGRAEAPGQVLLQTFSPEHPVMQALVGGDLAAFMAQESAARRPGHWPPHGRLAALIVSADDAASADATARDLGRTAPRADGVVVLGPAPAPLAILRGRHRRRLLLKARRDVAVQPLLRAWLAQVPVVRGGAGGRGRGPRLVPVMTMRGWRASVHVMPCHANRAAFALTVLAGSAALAQTAPAPRLTGVLIAPGSRVAILAHDTDGSSTAAEEGDRDGAYRVQSIAADSVTLAGPDGPLTLRLQPRDGVRGDSARPGASAAELGSVASGLQTGRAAVRYDACVQRGLLPRTDVTAAVELGRVVDAMANVPRRTGADWRLDPPARDMAMWTRLGLQEAEREPRPEPTPATCQAAAANWAGEARRFGVP